MKSLSAVILLFSILQAPAQTQSLLSVTDHRAVNALDQLYLDFTKELQPKVLDFSIPVYSDAFLKNRIPDTLVRELFFQKEWIEVWDEETFDIQMALVELEYDGSTWTAVRFSAESVFIQVNASTHFYLPRKKLKGLNQDRLMLLSDFQVKTKTDTLNRDWIREHAADYYNLLQDKIYSGIQNGSLPIYYPEYDREIERKMDLAHFDTLCDMQFWQYDPESETEFPVVMEFENTDVSGLCFRYKITTDAKGTRLEMTHFGPSYNPEVGGVPLPERPICWIPVGSLGKTLNPVEQVFLQYLLNHAIMENLRSGENE